MRTPIFVLIWLAVAAAIFGGAVAFGNDYVFFAGYVVMQYVVLSTAWNILGGYCGYVNFGSAAFFALGAYSTVAVHKLYPLPIPLLVIVGGIVSGIVGLGMGYLTLRLMAVDPIRIKRIAFGISIATASLAGAFLIIIQPVEPSVGRDYIGRIFAICVLGGMGSLPGTVIAAMFIGIVESITSTFYGPSWAPAVSFGFLLLTLAVRPAGLLGR